ncbi:MAG TPA: DUF4382 domain-containing protein [Candidatus Bathyarchaeia archaeon]|nr:DUF4382 domain-containing protein [Candidatus Bathyarchaeia archaeon]
MRQSRFSVYVVLICAVCLAGILPLGCPSPEGKSNVTVLLAGDAGLTAAKTRLDLESVASLDVTVTEITLDYCPTAEGEGEGEVGEGEGEGEVGEGEGEGEKAEGEGEGECDECECCDDKERIVVFTGEKKVNLRDLSGISEVISTADLPAGSYCKIRLAIETPRLVLVQADVPGTVLEEVQLTANGHLFVSGGFVLPEGESSLVLLDFESFHLVQAGNSGKYVLTPQLRATIQVQSAEAQATGAIAAIDPVTSMLTLDVDDSDAVIDVDFTAAAIVRADLTPGDPADLVVGTHIQVTGTLSVSGVITADTISLIAP